MKKIIVCSLCMVFLTSFSAMSQDFVYKAVNPAFGGNYLNYTWLLSSANAQNDYSEDTSTGYDTDDPLADFETTMNRQILSQLSQSLMQNYFGEELKEGQYKIGNYEIEIAPGVNGLDVAIFDTTTGDKTTVTVPYY
jgi:curli production assembly/transport component CsgF